MPEELKNREENPSKGFHDKFLEDWKTDPVKFVGGINDYVDPFDRTGMGEMYVANAINAGEINANEFDGASVQWLETIDVGKIQEDFINHPKGTYSLSFRLEHLLLLVMPNRKGETKFPNAVAWFKKNKNALLAINIKDDGGHWENSVKRILKDYIK